MQGKIMRQKLHLKIQGQTFLKGKCQMVDLLVSKIKVLKKNSKGQKLHLIIEGGKI